METLRLSQFKKYLKPRASDTHKNDYGRVLVVGGDLGYSGAVRLAAEAALRVGAGVVSVGTRIDYAAILNVTCPEIMCHGIGFANELNDILERASVVVVGPGLGQEGWGREIFEYVLASDKPLVVDADALNLLARKKRLITRSNWILTPHPGEAARLLKTTTEKIQANRAGSLNKLQNMFDGVVVLKGSGTLISTAEQKSAICKAGNPGMATAGMGDVLSGVVAGLVAQHIPLFEAAKLGVLVHALAGDLAAEAGERGLMASDLMPYLRYVVNGL